MWSKRWQGECLCIYWLYIHSVCVDDELCEKQVRRDKLCWTCRWLYSQSKERATARACKECWENSCVEKILQIIVTENGEQLSPACVNELIKAQALKFSHLHRLDQFIQNTVCMSLVDSLWRITMHCVAHTGTIITAIRAWLGVGRACFLCRRRPETWDVDGNSLRTKP